MFCLARLFQTLKNKIFSTNLDVLTCHMHFTLMFSCVFDSFYGFMCNGFTVQPCHHSFHFGTHLWLVILLSPVQPLTLSVTVYHTLSRLNAMFHSLEVLRTEQLCDSLNVRPFFQDGARSYSTTNVCKLITFWFSSALTNSNFQTFP